MSTDKETLLTIFRLKSYGWGTGFFINDQYLVTNHHVIEPFLEYGAGKDIELLIDDGTETWGKNDATVTSGTISRLYTKSGTGQQNVQTDCDIKHGNSGGPVVTPDGYAVGVATWGVTDSGDLETVNYAVNISEVITLLHVYGVEYTLVSNVPDSTQPTTGYTLLIVGIAVAALLVVAVVAILVMKKKKPAPAPAAAPAAPVLKPMIRSYAQANYGASIAIGTQPVLVGRNTVCALRFPNNAPGISGSHCSVQWDPSMQVFIVTDLNSTYGTYLISGQRLQPNQPCRLCAGDRFYLGEQGNIISLTME